MGDGACVTGGRHELSDEPGFPSSVSNDSAVHDSASIQQLLTQAINETRDRGRHRAVGTHRHEPTGVHPETRLGQRFARRRARADGVAVALRIPSETYSERDAPEHDLRRDAAATFPRIPPFTSRLIPATHLEI